MGRFEQALHRKSIEQLQADAVEREFAEGLFTEWRDRYIATLCGHIRLSRQAKELGLKPPWPSMDWCNAAVQILTHADLATQDYFMRARHDLKDELVSAVLQDKGITRMDGFFVELPPV